MLALALTNVSQSPGLGNQVLLRVPVSARAQCRQTGQIPGMSLLQLDAIPRFRTTTAPSITLDSQGYN
jgi:hypothetical protein